MSSSPSTEPLPRFNVGGVWRTRPFRIRRLGHIGFNCTNLDRTLPFYRDLLGFRVADRIDFSQRAKPGQLDGLGDAGGYFMHHGSDHHSFVLFNKHIVEALGQFSPEPHDVRLNQISWHVGSLNEVVRGEAWLRARGVSIRRSGRDWPGSNWHVYFFDPEGHNQELFYGMEQIGWQGTSKPTAMEPAIRRRETPALPQEAEHRELRHALDGGIDFTALPEQPEELPYRFDVGGVLLPRPFCITSIGPLSLFTRDVERAVEMYTSALGLRVTEESRPYGHRCVYLRAGSEHHSLVLCAAELKQHVPLAVDSTTMSFGIQVASYQQLCDARRFLAANGVECITVAPDLHLGIDYAFHVLDPEGHCVQFYHAMERLGWENVPRPVSARPTVRDGAWPSILDDDAGCEGDVWMGPLA